MTTSIFDQPLPSLNAWSSTVPQFVFSRAQCADHGFDPWLIAMGQTYDEAYARNALLSWVSKSLADYTPDASITTILKNPGDRYRAMSALQKAIRRNNPHMAKRAAHAMVAAGLSSTVWRRLAVISLEDIGLAAPFEMAAVNLIATTKAFKGSEGSVAALYWCIDQMCEAPKSRDLVDVVVWYFLGCSSKDTRSILDQMGPLDLVDVAMNDHADLQTRITAYWLLEASKHDPWKKGLPGAHPELVEKVWDAMDCLPIVRLFATLGKKAANEALHIPIPFIWHLMEVSKSASITEDPFENNDDTLVGTTYGAALDKHTYQGKAAINKFAANCKPVREWLDAHPGVDRMALVERAVFYVEGALLRPRLYYDLSHELYNDVLRDKLAVTKVASLSEGIQFFNLVSVNLSVLNTIRKGAGA